MFASIFTVLVVLPCIALSLEKNPEFAAYKLAHPEEFSGKFEGDMVNPPTTGGFRNAKLGPKRWWKGILYYDITRIDSPTQKRSIREALSVLEKRVGDCIQFKERTTEPHYVEVFNGNGCFSSVGRTGGKQTLSLQYPGCNLDGTIQHEFLHALGFVHEQSRSDRDSYLDIHWENISPSMKHNFEIGPMDRLNTPYEYGSVMHYGKYAFSMNGYPTMTPKEKGANIGTRKLHQRDVEMVRRYYGCYKPKFQRIQDPCVDRKPEPCNRLFKRKCRESISYTTSNCEKMCGFCEGTALGPLECDDTMDACYLYMDRCHTEDIGDKWIQTSCRKSCKLCT